MSALPEPQYQETETWPAGVGQVRRVLHAQFGATLPRETIDNAIAFELSRFADCRITTFVPVLVERFARARLESRRSGPTSA